MKKNLLILLSSLNIFKFFKNTKFISTILIASISYSVISSLIFEQQKSTLKSDISKLTIQETNLKSQLAKINSDLSDLKNQDQYKINQDLKQKINNIETTYKKSVTSYEKLLDLKSSAPKTNTSAMDKLFAESLKLLSDQNYASADAKLITLNKQIDDEKAKIASTFSIPQNVAVNNSAPGSGYSRQKVSSPIGEFLVDIIAADLGSTRVIVDTASDGTCANDCPVLSLADYVGRNGAFAGVNGSYFCPAAYPSCAGRTNSFDTLLMNKNKVYFNSDNNVYSTVPAVIFGNGWIRFVGQSLEWGRDTGVDGVLANQPLTLSGGNVSFGGDGDPKKGSRGSRSFVGNKGNTVYIGVIHNATVAEVGHALKTMGLDNALNLDSGGSTALWSGGYKAGPGRNIPNAILFVRK